MNETVKTKWLAALRSGEYTQGSGALHRDGAFCCLGVLCDIHAKETGTPWLKGGYLPSLAYLRRADLLPDDVVYWAGLASDVGGVVDVPVGKLPDGAGARYPLPELNDMGVPFDVVADLIEAQL